MQKTTNDRAQQVTIPPIQQKKQKDVIQWHPLDLDRHVDWEGGMLLLRFGQLAWTSLALAECLLLKGCWLNIDLENGQPWHKLPTIELKLGDMLSRKETHRSIPDNSGVSVRGIFGKDWQRRRLGSAKMSFQKKKQIIEWKQECPLNKGRRFTYVIGRLSPIQKQTFIHTLPLSTKLQNFFPFISGPKRILWEDKGYSTSIESNWKCPFLLSRLFQQTVLISPHWKTRKPIYVKGLLYHCLHWIAERYKEEIVHALQYCSLWLLQFSVHALIDAGSFLRSFPWPGHG